MPRPDPEAIARRNERIKELCLQGLTDRRVASILHLLPNTVTHVRRQMGIPGYGHDFAPAVVQVPCTQCGKREQKRRGLCGPCIRKSPDPDEEQTEEELDAVIAEQMKNLPDWFYENEPEDD